MHTYKPEDAAPRSTDNKHDYKKETKSTSNITWEFLEITTGHRQHMGTPTYTQLGILEVMLSCCRVTKLKFKFTAVNEQVILHNIL